MLRFYSPIRCLQLSSTIRARKNGYLQSKKHSSCRSRNQAKAPQGEKKAELSHRRGLEMANDQVLNAL
jgi:hypothetical protein